MVSTEHKDDSADLVGRVVEEYFERLRRGEHPQLEEFVERYPEISDLLRTVIPGLQAADQSLDVSADGKVSREQTKQLGDFRILRQIGRGGMGIVYEADQISMKRRVALKVLPLAGLVDELKIRRFQNEVRAVAALNHPNIVPVYMVGEERGVHYFAMQLIRGRSLSEVISSLRHVRDEGKEFNGSSISQLTGRDDRAEVDVDASTELFGADSHREADAGTVATANSSTIPHSSRREYYRSVVALGIQAATALQHAHDEGIIHRDIKPGNLLLDGSAKLYVTDFGLARVEADAGVTMTGDLIGTLRYMAPEQALAKRVVVDHRADIYSLAVTLYELLTLRPAYLAEDRRQLLKQIAFEEPTLLRRIDRDIPAELETIVHKAMAKDMDQRYSSAREFADDLRSHLENRPIQAKPPTVSEIISKWTRRNPILTWSTIITLSLVTMTLVASTFIVLKQRDVARNAERDARKSELDARQTAETRRQELYVAQVNLAHQAWIEGDLELARNLLALQRPSSNQTDLRGFEWRYLWQLCQDESRRPLATRGTTDGTHQMSVSADGGRLAIADGKMVRIWEFPGGRELSPVAPHATNVQWLEFSPTNPGLLATADRDGTINLWDLTASASPFILAKNTSARHLAFSPDGEKLASANGDGHVELWDVETRTRKWSELGHWDEIPARKKERPALCVAFSPDGEHVASGGGDTKVRLWNAATGEQDGPPLEGHTAWVLTMDFSPDGRLLATSGIDSRVLLWDVATRQAGPPLLGHKGPVNSIAFSPDGETLVSGGSDNTVRSWSVATSRQIGILRGHIRGVSSLAFLPGGKSLVSSSANTVKLWDAPPYRSKNILTEHEGWVEALALSPDGKTLVTSDFHNLALILWDVPTRSPLGVLRGHADFPRSVAISPDGKFLASGGAGSDDTVRLWDLSNHDTIAIYQCGFDIESVTFSSDGKILGAAGDGIKFWNVASEREIELIRGDTHSINRATFSPCGGLLATSDGDGRVTVWDADDGREVTKCVDESGASSLTFSSDGHVVAWANHDRSIALFDVKRGEIVRRLEGHTSGVVSIAFAPDSKTLASASWDSTVKLWNVATGQTALTVQHLGPATDVTFSNDGLLMVTCGADATARLWPAASLSEADVSLRSQATDRSR